MEQLLIVEDDIGLNQGLCKALKVDDRKIISCKDLKTAKEQLLCGGVSLILLDINLPDGSGLELLREVKETIPGIPVILLTANDTDLDIVDGLDRPTSGTVMVDGQDIFSLKEEALTIFRRRKIGFVFQSYNLVPVLNVYENIILPTELDGGKVNKAFVQQIVQTLGLSNRLDALPNQLSGGQQQRVAIARALAAAPAIILADEPTGNLDSKTSQDVLNLLKVRSQKFAQTIVMITHNEEIAQLSDRSIRIEDGRIVTGR